MTLFKVRSLSFFFLLTHLISPVFATSITAYSRYTLSVTANVAERRVTGTETISFTNRFKTPIDRIYVRLTNHGRSPNPHLPGFANDIGYVDGFEATGIAIHAATLADGTPLIYRFINDPAKRQKFSIDETLCEIQLPNPINPGECRTIQLRFDVKIPHSYSHFLAGEEKWAFKDSLILRFGWYPVEVAQSETDWLFESGSIQPHFVDSLRVDFPGGYEAAVAGDEVSMRDGPTSNTVTTRFLNPVSTVAFAIGHGFRRVTTNAGTTAIEVISVDDAPDQTARITAAARNAIAAYTEKYGPLSTRRVTLINTPFPGIWGMAADGFILLGQGEFGSARLWAPDLSDRIIDYIVFHEVAHLWAGVGTTVDHYRENVLSEGLADYLAISRLEETYGKTENLVDSENTSFFANLYIRLFKRGLMASFTRSDVSHLNYIQNVRAGFDEPVIQAPEKQILNGRSIRDYDKGYLVFTTLENYVGKSTMDAGLRDYFSGNNHRLVSAEDFKAALQRHTDRPLTLFFDKWFYSVDPIDFAVAGIRPSGSATEVIIRKTGTAPSALEVETIFEAGRNRNMIAETTENMTVLIPPAIQGPLRGVILDPDRRVAETNKHNNKTIDNLDVYVFGDVPALHRRHPQENYFLGISPEFFSRRHFIESGERTFGIRIDGSDSVTHTWYTSIASVQGGSDTQYTLGGNWMLDRNQLIKGAIVYDSRRTLDYMLGVQFPIYSELDIGYYGHYYYPSSTLLIGLARSENWAYDFAAHYLIAKASHINVNQGWAVVADTQYAPVVNGWNQIEFAKADIHGVWALRLAPNLILAPQTRIGVGRNLPRGFEFDLSELRGRSLNQLGNNLTQFSIDLAFPIVRGEQIPLFGMVQVRSICGSVYYDVANVWNSSLYDLDPNTFHPIAGMEVGLLLTTVADTPIPLTIGYAVPLPPKVKVHEEAMYYFSFNSPLTLFTAVFGF